MSNNIFEGQIRAAQTYTIDFPIQQPQRFVPIIQRELDARRAAIYR
jgi:hypothetical protein